jgi:hypothetical protein
MRTLPAALAAMSTAVVLATSLARGLAQTNPPVISFHNNGRLTFTKMTNAASYRVEWASSLSKGAWTNFSAAAAALDNIISPGSGTVTVLVPMFYRVVATVEESYDLVITEIMYDPAAVADAGGEWFEVFNRGSKTVDLNGLRIESGAELHVISNRVPLLVPAGGYLVLGRSVDPLANGAAPVDYGYSGITLLNSADSIALYHGTNLIDSVSYSASSPFPTVTGASIYLKMNALSGTANDSGTNWAASTVVFGGGDRGTPGAAN